MIFRTFYKTLHQFRRGKRYQWLSIRGEDDLKTGGYSIARQLWSRGYETRMIPVWEVSRKIVHVAHGTAAVSDQKPLHHRSAQRRAQQRARALMAEGWVEQLRRDTFLDAA